MTQYMLVVIEVTIMLLGAFGLMWGV